MVALTFIEYTVLIYYFTTHPEVDFYSDMVGRCYAYVIPGHGCDYEAVHGPDGSTQFNIAIAGKSTPLCIYKAERRQEAIPC